MFKLCLLLAVSATALQWEHVSEICPADQSTSLENCGFPRATAKDINGLDVSSDMKLTVYKVMNMRGAVLEQIVIECANVKDCTDESIEAAPMFSFREPSNYIFEYRAKDSSGRNAEAVTFALFIDDQEAPTIVDGSSDTIEACNSPDCSVAFPSIAITDNVAYNSLGVRYTLRRGTDSVSCQRYNQVYGSTDVSDECQAQFATLTTKTGTLNLGVKAFDKAGVYGKNGQNNGAHFVKSYDVVDTTPPTITLNPATSATQECCTRNYPTEGLGCDAHYSDPGAVLTDTVDGNIALPVAGQRGTITQRDVDISNVGTYTVKFNGMDNSNNAAAQVTRTVIVTDNTPPMILLSGPKVQDAHQFDVLQRDHGREVPNEDGTGYTRVVDGSPWGKEIEVELGLEVIDNCVGGRKQVGVRDDWDFLFRGHSTQQLGDGLEISYQITGPSTGQSGTDYTNRPRMIFQTIGTYIIDYTVKDSHGLESSAQRVVNIVDKSAPTITINGDDTVYVEVTDRDGAGPNTWEDEGALCSDYLREHINWESTGENVNVRQVGTYTVRYTCTDMAGNTALPKERTVIVEDTTAPQFQMHGGVDCPNCPERIDNTYTVVKNELEAGFPYEEPSGDASDNYATAAQLTVKVSSSIAAESESKKWNFDSCAAIKAFDTGDVSTKSSGHYFVTREVSGGFKKVRVYCNMEQGLTFLSPSNNLPCEYYGMTPGSDGRCYVAQELSEGAIPQGYTEQYREVFRDDEITHQDAKLTKGRYTYSYRITDAEGNTNNCEQASNSRCNAATKHSYIRVVDVLDRLPPVISLHDRVTNKLLFQSPSPFTSYMAQTTQLNGWAFAAVACAVTGMALLGFSKKGAAPVPV